MASQRPGSNLTPKQGLGFVKRHGVVLQAARGRVPSLAEAIAGEPIRGSWWGHPKGPEIFHVVEAVCESPEVLVCKLVDGKVTYIHQRLWPALVKLASRFRRDQLAKVWNEHTPTGAHRSRQMPYPDWVPREVIRHARRLSIAEAERILSSWPVLEGKGTKGRSVNRMPPNKAMQRTTLLVAADRQGVRRTPINVKISCRAESTVQRSEP